MKKKILYILPDYSYATLNSLSIFNRPDKFEIKVVAPYNINLLSNSILKKNKAIRRRINDWQTYSFPGIKIITNNPFKLIQSLWQYYKKYKFLNLTSILKRNLELQVIKKIDFAKYDILFSFDGCSLVYQKAAKEKGLVTIMESRGNHIDIISEINGKINECYGTHLPVKDDPGETWFNKLRTEVDFSDIIVTYSEFQRKQFQERLKTSQQMVLKIPILSKFTFRPVAKKYSDGFTFIFVGNQAISKGLNLIKTIWYKRINEIPDNISLSIIGNISSENAEFEKTKRIKYLGYFSPEKLKKYFSNNDLVLIHPSFYESYGMIIPEALSYCIPVITNQYCGASELIIHEKYGLVYDNPFNTNKLEEMIISVVQNSSVARAFSENIANSFDPSIVENQRNEEMGKLIQSIKTKLK